MSHPDGGISFEDMSTTCLELKKGNEKHSRDQLICKIISEPSALQAEAALVFAMGTHGWARLSRLKGTRARDVHI